MVRMTEAISIGNHRDLSLAVQKMKGGNNFTVFVLIGIRLMKV